LESIYGELSFESYSFHDGYNIVLDGQGAEIIPSTGDEIQSFLKVKPPSFSSASSYYYYDYYDSYYSYSTPYSYRLPHILPLILPRILPLILPRILPVALPHILLILRQFFL
jgi:hypothetical protein